MHGLITIDRGNETDQDVANRITCMYADLIDEARGCDYVSLMRKGTHNCVLHLMCNIRNPPCMRIFSINFSEVVNFIVTSLEQCISIKLKSKFHWMQMETAG